MIPHTDHCNESSLPSCYRSYSIVQEEMKLLECRKEDLEIRKQRIKLINEEALAERNLSTERMHSQKCKNTNKMQEAAPSIVLCPSSSASDSSHEEEEEIIPATPDQSENEGGDDDGNEHVAKSEDDNAATKNGVPSNEEYMALINSLSPDEDRTRLTFCMQMAMQIRENYMDADVVSGIHMAFLSRCRIATKLAHIDSVCMPGLKDHLMGIRIPAYEAHMQSRLDKCSEKLQNVQRMAKAWAASSAKQELQRLSCRMSHYCSLVHLALLRMFLPSDSEDALMHGICSRQDGNEGSKARKGRKRRVDWYDLDMICFHLHETDSMEGIFSRISPRRHDVLSKAENASCDRIETRLISERQRWSLIAEEESSANAATASVLDASAEMIAAAAEHTGKAVYARKKLRDTRWECKVHVATMLCWIARALILDKGSIARDLFVQKFGQAAGKESSSSKRMKNA